MHQNRIEIMSQIPRYGPYSGYLYLRPGKNIKNLFRNIYLFYYWAFSNITIRNTVNTVPQSRCPAFVQKNCLFSLSKGVDLLLMLFCHDAVVAL